MTKPSEWHLFTAFRSRNYTLYFIGRSVSQFGTWMQRTAVSLGSIHNNEKPPMAGNHSIRRDIPFFFVLGGGWRSSGPL